MYKIETHCHTKESSPCGHVSAKKLIKEYENIGYDYIIITDHYSKYGFQGFKSSNWEKCADHFLLGYRSCKNAADKIKVFLGMEITFIDSLNDYLVYGFDEKFIYKHKNLHHMTLSSFHRFAKEHNLTIIQAHPFRPNLTRADTSLIDAVEVFNGNKRQDSNNDLAYKYAKKHNLLMTSGSDFHQLEDLATGGMSLKQRIKSINDFTKALENNELRLINNNAPPY